MTFLSALTHPQISRIPYDRIDVFYLLVSMDELARVEDSVTIALGGASVIGGTPIIHHGTEEQEAKWLPGLFSSRPASV